MMRGDAGPELGPFNQLVERGEGISTWGTKIFVQFINPTTAELPLTYTDETLMRDRAGQFGEPLMSAEGH
jgi:hypothetical protein